jgi:hypothetical protein
VSRPPRPEPARPLRTELVPRAGRLDYMPLGFDELVALASRVGGGALTPGEGDPTTTLHELAALVAHVLAVHQDHFASEAFLGTARTARGLVKHGRRLAYESDPGSTATGYLQIEVKAGLAGELPANLAAATSPRAGAPAQDFATTAARRVDAAWNRLEVRAQDREAIVTVASTARTLRLAGTGYGLRAGEPALLIGPASWRGLDVLAVAEQGGETILTLASELGVALGPANDPAGYRVLGRPAIEARLFGWDADPTLFPASELTSRTPYTPPSGPLTETSLAYGYAAPSPSTTRDIFLSRALDEQLVGQHVLIAQGAARSVVRVGSIDSTPPQDDVAVRFVRGGTRQELARVDVSPTSVTPVFRWVLDERAISSTVTRLHLVDRGGTAYTRAQAGMRSALFALWAQSAPLVSRAPSDAVILPGANLYVGGKHGGLEPGMVVALATRDGARAQIVELVDVELTGEHTRLRYKERTPPPVRGDGTPHRFRLGDLVVLGNVVPIAHGTTREETLGESDGVTPFQRYKLKQAPLAYLPGGNAVEPELEVRVGGVRWERAFTFCPASGAAPTAAPARHYKLEREHDGATWIRFGDGRTCALPPAGRGNITARYRVGLGSGGNVAAGQLTRLVKNHPLVDRVVNPVATGGGTEPASGEAIRHQATRYIRTFDRAVSIRDHADLALLFPGVARASARLADGRIELTAATADGAPLPDRDKLFELLDARRDTTLPLAPADPVALPIAVRLYIEPDPAFLPRDVEAAIRAALLGAAPAAPGLFTFAARDLGQAAHRSEVHAALARVPGVSFAQLLIFDLAPGTGLRDVLQPRPHEWLRLEAAALTFAPPTEGDLD